jgi:hypothetical protein
MSRPIRSLNHPWLSRALAAVVTVALFATAALAQAPKIGDYYVDKSDLGFKVKVPKDWKFIPPQPGEKNMIGKYDPAGEKGIQLKQGTVYWPYSAWLLKFDRRKAAAADGKPVEGERRIEIPGARDIAAWTTGDGPEAPGANFKKTGESKLAISGVDASEVIFEGELDKTKVRLYAAVYKLSPDLEVALVFNGPGDDKKWAKFEGPFTTMAKSFKLLAMEEKAAGGAATGGSLRSQKRAELQDLIQRQPGWTLYETDNYFVLSNNPDVPFIDELKMRLEAIRKVYEETYPPSKADELRKLRDAARAKRKAEGTPPPEKKEGEDATDEDEGDDDKSVAQPLDPREASKCSVVRVVQNEEQYQSYGGPPRSAGYWSPMQQELVIYDDKAEGGRRNTWATLNHEAFHQYIFYFFGKLSPHSWYNEGTGDFYSGYQLKNNRFELSPFDWRVDTIKESIRDEVYVPLKVLVKFTQAEYYGNNKFGEKAGGGQMYAEGWSLIWFLRTGSKKAHCWNKAWDGILDTYLRVLVETDDLNKAVDQAFAGVDWDEMEECWKSYIKKG